MIELKLSADEAVMLKRILEYYLSELRMEIAGTDSQDFRNTLKNEEVFLNKLMTALEAK